MMKRLALLLLALPTLHAQEPAVAAAAAPTQPLVTYDVVGTFPANVPVTRMTAPGASFLLEVTFPQTVPAITYLTFNLGAACVSGSYSYEGRTYPVTSGWYTAANADNNARTLSVATPIGTLAFWSWGLNSGFVNLPVQPYHPQPTNANPWPMGTGTFLAVEAVPQGPWNYTFTNLRGQSIMGYYANVFDLTGRLVLPKPVPLATR